MGHRIWEHNVDEAWLSDRKNFLMASEIKRLLADQRRLDARKLADVTHATQFVKLYGEKQGDDLDTLSRGPAARGHWMEAPAVRDLSEKTGKIVYHWDDKLIFRGCLGFSPDAMDVPAPVGVSFEFKDDAIVDESGGRHRAPTEIVEIKSYDSGNHFLRMAMVENEEPLEERWQVATAMVVCPTITVARLLFYAPQARSMFLKSYVRKDLKKEMDTVMRIRSNWVELGSLFDRRGYVTSVSEETIYQGYVALQSLGGL